MGSQVQHSSETGWPVIGRRPTGAPQDWARHVLFGPRRAPCSPESTARDLGRAVVGFADKIQREERAVRQEAARLSSEGERRAKDPATVSEIYTKAAATVPARSDLPAQTSDTSSPALEESLRVVLMGRTQAGKSTLLEVLSQDATSDRRGDGKQRFSRDVVARRCAEMPTVEIVDTPGVGALDGQADYDLAFGEVAGADVILWVASDDATREETAQALQRLGLMGKPLIVALNCRLDLDHPLRAEDFLANPSSLFVGVEGHHRRISRELATAGATYVRIVNIHADAAFRATREGDAALSQQYRNASQIDQIYAALSEELERYGLQRRLIRKVDAVRHPTIEYQARLLASVTELRHTLDQQEQFDLDLRIRLQRVIERAAEALESRTVTAVQERRDWYQHVDVTKDVREQWDGEIADLQREIAEAREDFDNALASGLEEVRQEVTAEWAALPPSATRIHSLAGSTSIYLNRAARTGIRVAVGILAASAGGPVGLAVYGLGDQVLSAVGLNPIMFLDELLGLIFKGKAEVHRQRRETVRAQMQPLLDDFLAKCQSRHKDVVAQSADAVGHRFSTRLDAVADARSTARVWADRADRIRATIDELDAATARALLRTADRPNLADAVVRAQRTPGTIALIEFTHESFAEAVLYPPDLCEPAAPAPPRQPNAATGQALHAMLSITPAAVEIRHMTASVGRVALHAAEVPVEIRQTWGEALTQFTDTDFAIEAMDPTGAEDGATHPRQGAHP